MKVGLRKACVSSAVLATLYGPSAMMARDLIWDPNATTAATGSDGSGNWDTAAPIWVDLATPGAKQIDGGRPAGSLEDLQTRPA